MRAIEPINEQDNERYKCKLLNENISESGREQMTHHRHSLRLFMNFKEKETPHSKIVS